MAMLYSHPGDTEPTKTCLLLEPTVLNAQGGSKFSMFLDPVNSLTGCQGGNHARWVMNKKGLAMSSSLKFPSVSASTGRSDMVRNAPGSSLSNRAVGRKVPKRLFISHLRTRSGPGQYKTS